MTWEVMTQNVADLAEVEPSNCSCSCNCSCGFWHPIRGIGASKAQRDGYTLGENLDPPALLQPLKLI